MSRLPILSAILAIAAAPAGTAESILWQPWSDGAFAAARRAPTHYKLVEWWDRREGPAPRGESIFPDLDHSAAFLCANGACSSPIPGAPALSPRLAKALAASGRH